MMTHHPALPGDPPDPSNLDATFWPTRPSPLRTPMTGTNVSTAPVPLPHRTSTMPSAGTERALAQAALRGRVAFGAVVVAFVVALTAIAYAIDWV